VVGLVGNITCNYLYEFGIITTRFQTLGTEAAGRKQVLAVGQGSVLGV